MQTPRYIGFSLDPDFEADLEALRRPLIGGNLRKPLTLHVTVITPPMMRQVEPSAIKKAIEPLISDSKPIGAIITGPHSFAGRAMYLGISSNEIKELQQNLMKALSIDSFLIEKVGKAIYTPHITLVQATGPLKLPTEVIDPIMSHDYPKRTTLKDIHVFENTGPRQYKTIESFELT